MWSKIRIKNSCVLCLLITTLALLVESQQQIQGSQDINHPQTEEELVLQEEFKNQINDQLQEWIIKQNEWNSQYPQIQTHQSFIFKLPIQTQYDFRMKAIPSTSKLISVSVYLAEDGKDITLPQNPNIQSYVQVRTSDSRASLSQIEGVIYIEKVFKIQFEQPYKYVRIVNNIEADVLIIVNMEQTDFSVNSKISDDKFQIANTKMQAIKSQLQATETNRQRMFKFQWGFQDKRKRHQRDMLQLTGAQLIAIIATSLVQIYCIKNLISRELII